MINKLIQNIVEVLIESDVISEDRKDIYVYGLDLIVSGMISVIAVFFMGIMIGEFFYTVIYNIIMVAVRIYTGGYHASTRFKCLISYMFVFIISMILLKMGFIRSNGIVGIIGILLAIIIVIIYAPLENKNKILSENQKRNYKIISLAEYGILIGITVIMKFINEIFKDNMSVNLLEYGNYIRILLVIISALLILEKIKELYKNYLL